MLENRLPQRFARSARQRLTMLLCLLGLAWPAFAEYPNQSFTAGELYKPTHPSHLGGGGGVGFGQRT